MIRPPPRSTLFLHDALPICPFTPMRQVLCFQLGCFASGHADAVKAPFASEKLKREGTKSGAYFSHICSRSEEHTSELQSHVNLVCRLLLEKKKIHNYHQEFN